MGIYKINDLEQLTGIKAHTIRIWEKRYGILKPERTETKIRLYSDKDVMMLLGVSLLNKNGLKISKIADLSHKEIRQKIQITSTQHPENVVHENLLISLMELNETLFLNTLDELTAAFGLEHVFTVHLIPFLEKIGVMWLVGTINPAQEHFISNLIRQKLIVEINRLPPPFVDKTAILFLPEHESHELSLIFYHFQLKKRGFKTFYLGQSLPFDSLLQCIDKIKPDYLITSWIISIEDNFIENYFQNLRKHCQLPIYAGGSQIVRHLNTVKPFVKPVQGGQDLPMA